ncbi:DNA-binding transcriptional activator of the SARP family [Nonomuraea solani]|uniref:DNA-binding transcriptional activator of the SARP family n=1 Tax=Nonomuraea solani TaxID=1144553 RepID=A0A1H6F172_9ACTN|nr:AfsR/SARP family transcriptional regulator [Nonomuraea solani]SEH03802.1 DNA-binding transcriptional activator of the SARP family [Nonomuraea solani]
MRFTVLGPVDLPKAAPRHRAVLAYLLLHAGTVISAERLIGAMWGAAPPDSARTQIHAAIAAIRRVLRSSGAEHLLETRSAGYVIRPEPGQLDLEAFTGQVTAAQAQAATAPELAAQHIRAALAMWRGQPLGGVNAAYVAEARQRLEERRLSAVERLAELELSLGRHHEIVHELAAHASAHPLREGLARHLMLALHRAGRQADALAVARSLRERLVEEKGLDPSRAFLTLEQAILRDDPSLQTEVDVRHDRPQPASFLPYDTPDFAGRDLELDRLASSLSADGGLVTISAIDGMAGIGKTTLAIHAAHRLADHYPDGQLFIDLHAHTAGRAPIKAEAALEGLLRQLGVPAERIPASLGERAALWRTELADRRVLVVLDNAADTEHVRPLLPGVSGSLILITSRRRLTDLDGAHALSLELLPAVDAVNLFGTIVGQRTEAEPDAVLEVLQLCGFLPLAVRIAAARLHHRPQWTVGYLAGRLRDHSRRLAELSTSERGVAAAFTLSHQQLDPHQQRLFRLLGLHPGTDIDAHAAAALADLPLDRVEAILEDLLDAHMLLQHEPGRYTFHDLLRDHARTTADAEDPADALARLFGHYAYTASTALDRLFPNERQTRPRTPQPDSPAVHFRDAADARAWLETERANLIATSAHTDPGWPSRANELATNVYLHLYRNVQARHEDAITLYTQALQASRRTDDKASEGRMLILLGWIHWQHGEYQMVREHGRLALQAYQEIGHRRGEAGALNLLGRLSWRQADYPQARQHYDLALDLCREIAERRGEAACLTNLGSLYSRLHEHERASDHLHRALDLYRELGIGSGEGAVLAGLGELSTRHADHPGACAYYRKALDVYRELGFRAFEPSALNGLGHAVRAMGEPARAIPHHDAALALATELGDRFEQAEAHNGLARAQYTLGRLGPARDHGKRSLALYSGLDVPEADTLRTYLDTLIFA